MISLITEMTPAELRSALEQEIKSSGITDDVTAHFRRMLIQRLDPSSISGATRPPPSLEDIALRSLLLDYLQTERFEQTASVFVPECRLQERMLSRDDSLRALGLELPVDAPPNHSALVSLLQSSSRTSSSNQAATTSSTTQTIPVILPPTSSAVNDDKENFTPNSTLVEFRKDLEARVRRECEADLKTLKEKEMVAMRHEEACKQREANDRFRFELKSQFNARMEEIERNEEKRIQELATQQSQAEQSLYNSRQELDRQTNKLKEQQEEGRQELTSKREQLELRERRVEQMLLSAKARMEEVEEKEHLLRKQVQEEYNKAHSSARKAYDDAAATNKSQNILLEKELQALNDQRNLLAQRHSDALALEKEVALLRTQNEELSSTLVESKRALESKDEALRKVQAELLSKRRNEAKQVLEYQRRLNSFDAENAQAKRIADAASRDRDDALNELDELRKLLSRSQSALASLNPTTFSRSTHNSFSEKRLRLERARKNVEQTICTTPPAAFERKKSHRPSLPATEERILFDSRLSEPIGCASERRTPPRDPSTAPGKDPPTGSTPTIPSRDPLDLKAFAAAPETRGGGNKTPMGIDINIPPASSSATSPVESALTDSEAVALLHCGEEDATSLQPLAKELNSGGDSNRGPDKIDEISTIIQTNDGDRDIHKEDTATKSKVDARSTPVQVSSSTGRQEGPSMTPEGASTHSDCYTFDHEDDDTKDEDGASTDDEGIRLPEANDKSPTTVEASPEAEEGAINNDIVSTDGFKDTGAGMSHAGDNSSSGTCMYQSDFDVSVSVTTAASSSSAD